MQLIKNKKKKKKTQNSLSKSFPNATYTQIFPKHNSQFNAAIADVHTITEPVYLISVTDCISQQHIAIHNNCTSVPLTDAHLHRTSPQTGRVQPQPSDHTLNHYKQQSCFQKHKNVFSTSK
jgi:hypothetical protein